MAKSKRLVASAAAAMLMLGAYAPAWAQPPAGAPTPSAQAPLQTGREEASMAEILGSILTERVDHVPVKRCPPGSLYSEHDVVGDSESCFLNRLGVPNGIVGTSGFSGGGAL